MTKKKGKPAARKATVKKGTKPTARAVARPAARTALSTGGSGPASQITIFLFRTGSGNKIRTSPQRAYAGPGKVEWTVVNMIDGSDVPVRITWPNGSPWQKESIEFRNYHVESAAGVKPDVYKYVVHAFDTQEDPEIEFPQN
jgi:hypothetical protein